MEYITVANGIITGHFCGETLPDGAIQVPDGFPGWEGLPVDAITADYSAIKPLSQQVFEGVVSIPDGYKINKEDNEFIRMNQDEIDALFPPEVWAVPESFDAVVVKRTFDRYGNFGYFAPENTIKMKGEQPTAYHKAESDGTWTTDADRAKAAELAQAKAERADAVSKIVVTVDGMVFDGDEISQERMSRTITAAVATGEDMSATTTWVLADNSVAQVSITQLAQALRLAGGKQTELWTFPYETETTE